MNKITHIVFDLGGVVVKLRGTPLKPEWFSKNTIPTDIWEKWLSSAAPKQFESGNLPVEEFCDQVIRELNLEVSKEAFLHYFSALPEAPFPGAIPLLKRLKAKYVLALFSNSNVLHWERKMNEMKLRPCFDYHFASHIMGLAKPDHQAFHYVIDHLNTRPENILFFDDNQLNIDSAKNTGINAVKVEGIEAVVSALEALSIEY